MTEINSSTEEVKNEKEGFPMNRIRTIIKSTADAEITLLNATAVHVMSKAAELFIQHLARQGLARTNKKLLEYKHIAEYVQSDDRLEFLHQIIPNKITFAQYKSIMEKEAAKNPDIDTESSSSEEEESESETEDDDDEEDNDDGSKNTGKVNGKKAKSESDSDVELIDDTKNNKGKK